MSLTNNDDLNLEPYIGLMLSYLNNKNQNMHKRKTPFLDSTQALSEDPSDAKRHRAIK